MRITDFHAHVFPEAIARKAVDNTAGFYGLTVSMNGTVSELLELHREAGISRGCIHSVAVTPRSADSINRFIAGEVKKHPGQLTGFGAVHPDCGDIPGLIREAKELGLKGLKIHPDMQRFALDSPAALDMFAAIEGEMPVIIHTGDPRYAWSSPRQMKKALDAFPKLVCVCAHLGGWREWDDAWRTLAGYENVYVDTSSSLYAMTPEKGRELIRRYDGERVLFGTDYPMWNPREELVRFRAVRLTDAEEERILCLNAERLLGPADGEPPPEEQKKEEKKMTRTLKIEGMMCMHCEARVKKALEAIPGVESAAADHDAGTAVVTLSAPVEDSVLTEAVTSQNYRVLGVE